MLYFCMHFEQNIYIVFQYCKHDIVDIFMYVKYKGDWILNSAWINVSNNWNIHLLRIYAHIIIVPFHDWLVSKAYLQIICQQLFTNKKVNNTNNKMRWNLILNNTLIHQIILQRTKNDIKRHNIRQQYFLYSIMLFLLVSSLFTKAQLTIGGKFTVYRNLNLSVYISIIKW